MKKVFDDQMILKLFEEDDIWTHSVCSDQFLLNRITVNITYLWEHASIIEQT